MSCRFGTLAAGFWRDARTLSPTARLVLAYVHTSEHRQLAGLYRLPLPYIASDLDLSPAEAQAALDELVAAGVLIYDAGPELVYASDWRRHDPLQSVSAAAPAVLRVLDALRAAPASPAAKAAAEVVLAEGGRLLLTAPANDNGRGKLERTLADLRRELTPGTAPEPTPPPVHPPSTTRRHPVDPPSTGPERAGLERAGSPDCQSFPSNNDCSPASAGSPRAPASKAKRARKAKAADQPDVPADALRLAELLASLMRANNPKAKIPGSLDGWALELGRCHRLDGYDWQEIERVLRWSQADAFWKANIRSGGKLREQMDRLVIESQRGNGKPAAHPAKSLPALDEAVSHA